VRLRTEACPQIRLWASTLIGLNDRKRIFNREEEVEKGKKTGKLVLFFFFFSYFFDFFDFVVFIYLCF
jgi:hypothetical protein